ncbi:hypothetical protein ONE63_006593 [Megalurothrips usitatus]|uniref:Luciferin 4-monooxygenase-like n=1 Tax=Megalurothrips usitatus TaxID=439358 RepID=A0AAV7XX32_9NEOP|nr:hypothetical protein ONE63_006593 [Megalurothrips usitatus]
MPPYHIRYTADGPPDCGLSYGGRVLEGLRKFQNSARPTQVDAHDGTAMTFRELLVQTVHAAEGWKAMGLRVGDVVALVSKNHHQVFPVTLGAVCAGLTVSCVVPTATKAEMQHAMSLSRPKVVVVEPARLATAMEAAPGARFVVLGGDPPAGVDSVSTHLQLLRRGETAEPPPDPDTYRAVDVGDRSKHVAFILFSSGTTGLPKGVQIRDSAMATVIDNISDTAVGAAYSNCYRPDDKVMLISSPLCWISGVWQLLYGCAHGLTRVFTRVVDDITVASTIDKYKVNSWMAAPAVLIAFESAYNSKHRTRYDLSSLTGILVGGSPTSAEVQTALERDLGCKVIQVYGATEAGLVFGPDGDRSSPPGSMGKLVPWVELRLVSADTGEDIPADTRHTVAEVRVRSPYLMHSYVNNAEETAKAHDELGFFKTGDLVYEDDDGYFFFVDRIKEMMKYKGNQIAPAELEMLLLQHPGVREACVLGAQSGVDDLPTAFVARAPNEAGAAVTEDDLKALVADKLSDYKQLRGGVIFLEHLPKTVTGKVARRELKDKLRSLA